MSSWVHEEFARHLFTLWPPRLIVELGVWRGESLAGLHAALSDTSPAVLIGIDRWEDRLAEHVCKKLFADQENVILYRSEFCEATRLFVGGTIDVLHVDGEHTFEELREVARDWFPLLRYPNGIVLLHDINVRSANIDVWRVWPDFEKSYLTTADPQGCGLGACWPGYRRNT